jgi:hypothetical protein
VIDPRGVETIGEGGRRGQDIDAHAEVPRVADAVVPPREPARPLAPTPDVEIDQSRGQDLAQGDAFVRRHVRRAGERVRVEHVMVRRCDVEVTTDQQRFAFLPPSGSFGQRRQEGELVLVVSMTDLAAVGHVHRRDPHPQRPVDHRAQHPGLAIERVVVEAPRPDHVDHRMTSGDGDPVVAAGSQRHDVETAACERFSDL